MQFPLPPPVFTGTPESILQESQHLIDQARSVQDSIATTITPDTAAFANTLLPIAHEQNERLYGRHMLEFYQNVSTDDKVREASRKAEKQFSELETELGMREDVSRLVKAVYDRNEDLDEECRRLLERQMLEYKRNGLHLGEEDRKRLQQISKELGDVKAQFEKNLSEEKGSVDFTKEELDGLPDDVFAGLESDGEGQYHLSFRPAHTSAVLGHVKIAGTRRKVYIGNVTKCNENVPLLEKAFILRDEAARLLGYSNHAEYRLEDKMEKSPQKINDFLEDVRLKLVPKGRVAIERLKQLKTEGLTARGEGNDGKFYLWDQSYYSRILVQRDYAVDHEKLAEYFPLDWVIERMLEIFAELMGMAFHQIPTGRGSENEELVWHGDVRMFAVYDDFEEGEVHKDFLGYLYMDVHPRAGKRPGLCDLSIHPGYINPSTSTRTHHPSTCLITNFPKSPTSKPTLLTHSDLWQLFHELGHGIHDLVSKTRFACFHGPETAQDFCEAPSQMLEKFCWTREVLQVLGRYWGSLSDEHRQAWQGEHPGEDIPSETIPADLIEGLLQSQTANRALFWLQSLHIAIFDMTIHQPKSHEQARNINTTKLWNALKSAILGIDAPEGDEGGHGQAIFGHLFSGYDAGFYSCLSSQVYACDMFASKFSADPLKREEGMRWRREVLEKGGSRDEMEGMRVFLGREVGSEAFGAWLGV
ncbi:hypothetical protein M409DRAFT_36542 [Zasmidium cellare ATCC 36951]|uniref:Peptidase M3A/M3B catalytic domain-containing protein n=1 Tax=Zasmidium cellare ATCC 36951 TaxID=1080233 RepID=A0A6A6CJI6_ZASCE|nr:uncharacterized protein M409DRAFT_36542 [Zasmidium cellare ATCC 36951]KAF2167404.1 hypothetical protein M409DRAFT_36542 [Zasmidium cellare ATCC 36951]